jgi:Cytochrome P460
MKSRTMLTIASATWTIAILGAVIVAQDKYSLKVPGGLAFSEFRGYEDWAVVAVHHTEDLTKVVLGNPVTMDAFRAGVPGNGKPFPDGSKMAKVEWRPKKSPDAPYDITVPGTVYDLGLHGQGCQAIR